MPFFYYDVAEIETCFVLKSTLYNPSRDERPSLLQILVLGGHKSSFQLDHQVHISFYLIEANTLRDCRKLTSLSPS